MTQPITILIEKSRKCLLIKSSLSAAIFINRVTHVPKYTLLINHNDPHLFDNFNVIIDTTPGYLKLPLALTLVLALQRLPLAVPAQYRRIPQMEQPWLCTATMVILGQLHRWPTGRCGLYFLTSRPHPRLITSPSDQIPVV